MLYSATHLSILVHISSTNLEIGDEFLKFISGLDQLGSQRSGGRKTETSFFKANLAKKIVRSLTLLILRENLNIGIFRISCWSF